MGDFCKLHHSRFYLCINFLGNIFLTWRMTLSTEFPVTTIVVAITIISPPTISCAVIGCPRKTTLKTTAVTGSKAPNIAVGVEPIICMAAEVQADSVSVAGYAGTLNIGDNTFLLDFCGYFPAENPQYSIVVTMCKEGIPASGGTMAGGVFKEIADYMVREKFVK